MRVGDKFYYKEDKNLIGIILEINGSHTRIEWVQFPGNIGLKENYNTYWASQNFISFHTNSKRNLPDWW